MPDPISVPIPTDPDELAALAFDYMEANVPDWDRSRGDAASQVLAACAQIDALLNETASDQPFTALRYLGRWVDGLAAIDATPAQTTATVDALDDAGYTVTDGTRFEIRTSGDTGQVFFAVGDVTIAPGDTATATGEVVLVAETAGEAGSGLPADSTVVPVDALAWIDTVTLTAITTAGVDAETDDDYLVRWIVLRALSNDTPVLAVDAAALLKNLIPGIDRTMALDNFDPGAMTFGNEKFVSVAASDVLGEPVAGGLKTAGEELVESKRELNFSMHVIDFNYRSIDIASTFSVIDGFDGPTTETAVEDALASYLSPAVFGSDGTVGSADTSVVVAKTHVRYLEIAAVINAVEGVDEISALTLGRVQSVTGVAATDLFTAVAHGLAADDPVVFGGLTGGAGITAGTTYYVIASGLTADAAKVSATLGGASINFTTDLSAGTLRSMKSVDVPLSTIAPMTRPGTIVATAT